MISSLLEDVPSQVSRCCGLACLQRCLQCLEFGFVRVRELELEIFTGLATQYRHTVLHTGFWIKIISLEEVDIDCTGIVPHFVLHWCFPDTPASRKRGDFRNSCASCIIEVVGIAHRHAFLDLIIHSTFARISARWLCDLLSWASLR
jgi:hypothetical protein